MNREQIKNFVWQTLLEVVDYPCKVEGKLLSKKIGYGGIERSVVFEGTVDETNAFASENEFVYNNSNDSSYGGGYFEDSDGLVYEFHPNPEFYGDMMEANSTAWESLQRISGLSDRVLSEVDETLVTKLTDLIAKDKELHEGRIVSVLSNLAERRTKGLFDERNATRLWGIVINEALRKYSTDLGDITEIGDTERDNVARNLEKIYHRRENGLFENCGETYETTEDELGDLEETDIRKLGGPLVVNMPVATVRADSSLFY
jgi:hypothetical protein